MKNVFNYNFLWKVDSIRESDENQEKLRFFFQTIPIRLTVPLKPLLLKLFTKRKRVGTINRIWLTVVMVVLMREQSKGNKMKTDI